MKHLVGCLGIILICLGLVALSFLGGLVSSYLAAIIIIAAIINPNLNQK